MLSALTASGICDLVHFVQELSLKCVMSDKVGAKMAFWKLVVASASREKENQPEVFLSPDMWSQTCSSLDIWT